MQAGSNSKYLRNFVFGVEDSLVSTVGVLSGVAVAGKDAKQIILTGLILISVEAFSMAVGSLLTEQSADEVFAKKEISLTREIPSAIIMFSSYFLSGLLALFPYLFFPIPFAFPLSVVVSLLVLILLGIFRAKFAHVPVFKSTLQMFILGGVAVGVGALIGRLF